MKSRSVSKWVLINVGCSIIQSGGMSAGPSLALLGRFINAPDCSGLGFFLFVLFSV